VLLNLRHAGLPGANLIDARLMGVDPAHANIRGADLSTVEDLTEELNSARRKAMPLPSCPRTCTHRRTGRKKAAPPPAGSVGQASLRSPARAKKVRPPKHFDGFHHYSWAAGPTVTRSKTQCKLLKLEGGQSWPQPPFQAARAG